MKYAMSFLVVVLAVGMTACDSDNSTGPLAPIGIQKLIGDLPHGPIDPQQLVGRWEGTYKFTRHGNHDSPHGIRFNIQMEFTDTSYWFDEVPSSGICSNYGGGPYWVENRQMRFEDHTFRPALCIFYCLMHGSFSYRNNQNVTFLNLIHHSRYFHVQVKLRKVE